MPSQSRCPDLQLREVISPRPLGSWLERENNPRWQKPRLIDCWCTSYSQQLELHKANYKLPAIISSVQPYLQNFLSGRSIQNLLNHFTCGDSQLPGSAAKSLDDFATCKVGKDFCELRIWFDFHDWILQFTCRTSLRTPHTTHDILYTVADH